MDVLLILSEKEKKELSFQSKSIENIHSHGWKNVG